MLSETQNNRLKMNAIASGIGGAVVSISSRRNLELGKMLENGGADDETLRKVRREQELISSFLQAGQEINRMIYFDSDRLN